MAYHFAGRSPVRHNKTIESPLVTEYILQNKSIPGRRDSIIIIKWSHKRGCTRFGGSFKRWQINIAQTTFGNKRGIIITSSFGCTVTYKMFRASCNWSRAIQRISLKTFYHSSSHYGSKIRIFTTPFGNTSPARIAGNINHWRKSPPDTYRRSFNSCYPCTVFRYLRIERSRLSQGNRENCFKPVNDITRYQ